MPEVSAAPESGRKAGKDKQKNWLTSTLLIIFTLFVAIACIVALACTLTQTRVAALVIDGVGVSIPKLDYVGRQWAVQQRESRELFREEQRVLINDTILSDLRFDERLRARELEDRINTIIFRIQKSTPELAKELALSESDRAAGQDPRYGRIMGNREDLVAKDASIAVVIESIAAGYQEVREASERVASTQAEIDGMKARLVLLKKRIETSSTLFNYIKPDLDKDKDAKARIENAFYELNIDKFQCGIDDDECGPVGGYIARGLYHILTLRPDLLTLCLVILMGILGSTLQTSHAYFMKNQAQSLGGYFQRITVGAMTALVIFIVAKAGIPVLADTSRLGGDAPINPYLISFLAIISGLLSENAIANIQAQGRRYLGADDGTKRWARSDQTAALEKQNMSVDALAGHLGVDKTTAEAMLKGSTAMDAQQQKIMALSLRGDPRAIFTDIAPPTPAPAAT